MDGMNIYYNYTVEVNNTEHMATLKEGDIHLYIGDKNIDYYFKVEKAQFTFRGTSETESLIESTMPSKAAVSVLKPNGDIVIGSEAEVVGSRIKWTVTPDLIDEDVEVGDFTLAISLIESSTDSMATLPPITNQVHIHERVIPTPGSSLNAVVNEAVVGLAQVQSDDTALDVFDSEGNYIKTVWKSGDKITQTKLNKIEDGLSGLSTQCKDIAKQIESGNIGNNVEPQLMDMPRIYFSEGTLPTTKTATTLKFDYYSKTAEYHGWAEIKCQGNSSMSYAKKNFTIKLYKDQAKTEKLKIDFKGWGKQSKFVLKANWIDITHARNVVSARIWGDIVKSRAGYTNLPELLRTSPNQGAIDGFPITVYGNGYYQGRYTLNIPKDKWMSNMDDTLDTHCILCGENYYSGCFLQSANINGSDWTDELHDTVPNNIKTRWNEVISFVKDSTDEDFKANLSNYFDVESLIDYLLFGIMSTGLDAFGKNQIYFTYDGLKWIASMYDMDSTWGLWWNGSKFVATDYAREQFQDMTVAGDCTGEGNKLYIRLQQLFIPEIKARYSELRESIFTYPHLVNKFEKFIQICPLDIVKEDYASTTANGAYTGIPSTTTNNIQQLRNYIDARLIYVDSYINSLVEPISCTGITLDNTTLSFTTSDTQTLTATVTPSNTTNIITWSVSPTGIVSVENGVVTPIASGNCVITATCGLQTATCNVTVNELSYNVTSLNLNKNMLNFILPGVITEVDDTTTNYINGNSWTKGQFGTTKFLDTGTDITTVFTAPYPGFYEFSTTSTNANVNYFKICYIDEDKKIIGNVIQNSLTRGEVTIGVLKPNTLLGVSFYPNGLDVTDELLNTMQVKRIVTLDSLTNKDVEVSLDNIAKPGWSTTNEYNCLEFNVGTSFNIFAFKVGDLIFHYPTLNKYGSNDSILISCLENNSFSYINTILQFALPIDTFGTTVDSFKEYMTTNNLKIILNPTDYLETLNTTDGYIEEMLTASLVPTNATNKEVTWSVDNENVELVTDGLNCTVKAKAVGSSVVTCTSQDATNGTISDTCNVTVN